MQHLPTDLRESRSWPEWLSRWRKDGLDRAEALARFDALPAVEPAAMLGRWRGIELRTGHPLDGALEALGWYGKEFESPDRAQALVFRSGSGALIPVDPALLPVRIGLYLPRLAGIARAPGMGAAFSALLPAVRARGPTAQLREREFRGRASAAMIYEAQPIVDHFRQIANGSLLGLMDARGRLPPYFFMLLGNSR